MARKRSGSTSFATRSAAAKKGWETRRRGGAAANPAGGGRTTPTQRTSAKTKPTAAPAAKARPAPKGKAKPAAAPAKAPKTTTARGRARTKAAEARKALKAGGGTRAARSLRTAQRAADYYKATGTGTKRSRTGGSGGSKPAKAAAAKPARGKGGAKPATQTAGRPRTTGRTRRQAARSQQTRANRLLRWADYSISNSPNLKVTADSRVNREDGGYGFRPRNAAVFRFPKHRQPNLFGNVETIRNRKGSYYGQAVSVGNKRVAIRLRDLTGGVFFVSRGKAAENRKYADMIKTQPGGAVGSTRSRVRRRR